MIVDACGIPFEVKEIESNRKKKYGTQPVSEEQMNVKKAIRSFITGFVVFISAFVCRYILKNNSGRVKSIREDLRRATKTNKQLSRRKREIDGDYEKSKQTIQEIRDREQCNKNRFSYNTYRVFCVLYLQEFKLMRL